MDITEIQEGYRDSTPSWKAAADLEIKRLAEFHLFSPPETLDRSWLEEEARILQSGVGLPPLPVKFIIDLKEANAFADEHRGNPEWREVWGKLRDQARAAIPTSDYALTWGIARRNAEEAFAKAGAYGAIGKDAQRRAGSYIQWFGVQEQLGPNRMTPYIDVYEKGGALIARSSKEFGVYAPPTPANKRH